MKVFVCELTITVESDAFTLPVTLPVNSLPEKVPKSTVPVAVKSVNLPDACELTPIGVPSISPPPISTLLDIKSVTVKLFSELIEKF